MAPSLHSLQSTLYARLVGLAERSAAFLHCPKSSNDAWLTLGVTRALHDHPSGRGFLPPVGPLLLDCPATGHFFTILESARRPTLYQQANARGARLLTDDPFAHLDCLPDFDLYTAKGHWHGAAVHTTPLNDAKRAIGHSFVLNLRTQALRYLTHAQGKKEHDVHALKRLDPPPASRRPRRGKSSTPTTARASTVSNGKMDSKRRHLPHLPDQGKDEPDCHPRKSDRPHPPQSRRHRR